MMFVGSTFLTNLILLKVPILNVHFIPTSTFSVLFRGPGEELFCEEILGSVLHACMHLPQVSTQKRSLYFINISSVNKANNHPLTQSLVWNIMRSRRKAEWFTEI